MTTKRSLPDTRRGKTRATNIGNARLYMQTGEYENGDLGEIFLRLDKEGTEMRAYDLIAIAVSIGLQHGVPLDVYVDKFKHQRIKPNGFTNDPEIPNASSIIDYVARWLEKKYIIRN